jgi:hypothetical protein
LAGSRGMEGFERVEKALKWLFGHRKPISRKGLTDAIGAVADALEQVGDPRAAEIRRLRVERLPGQYLVRYGSDEPFRSVPYPVNNKIEQQRAHRRAVDLLAMHVRILLCVQCPLCVAGIRTIEPLGGGIRSLCLLCDYRSWVYRPLDWPGNLVRLAEAFRAGEDCGFALRDALLEAGQPQLANCVDPPADKPHVKQCLLDFLIGPRASG